MVSKKHLDKLKIIMKENYGLELTDEQVSRLGNGLVQEVEKHLKVAAEDCTEEDKENIYTLSGLLKTERNEFRKRLNLDKNSPTDP